MAAKGKKSTAPGKIPEEKVASEEEIRAAIESLTDAQTGRLEGYARARIRSLGRKARGRDGEDLLGEVMTLTIEGTRRWNKSVTFEGHLIGAMRSTVSNWAKQFNEDEPFLESELITQDADGNDRNPYRSAPRSNVEEGTPVRDLLDRIPPLLNDDPLAAQVFDGLREQLTGPEIQEILGITQAEYDGKMKKIRRRARPLLEQGD